MKLLFICRVFFFRLVEGLRIVFRYYPNTSFALLDLVLLSKYCLLNPYRMIREKRALWPYGETPLSTMERIATVCAFNSSDTVYDLGSGRGRAAFWLSSFVKCQVVGVDLFSPFIEKAKAVQKWHATSTQFLEADFFQIDFSKATCVYLYGSHFDDEKVERISSVLESTKRGTKIITVSYPLNGEFILEKTFEAAFPWGKTLLFYQIKR